MQLYVYYPNGTLKGIDPVVDAKPSGVIAQAVEASTTGETGMLAIVGENLAADEGERSVAIIAINGVKIFENVLPE